jgi:hypothetical protein
MKSPSLRTPEPDRDSRPRLKYLFESSLEFAPLMRMVPNAAVLPLYRVIPSRRPPKSALRQIAYGLITA